MANKIMFRLKIKERNGCWTIVARPVDMQPFMFGVGSSHDSIEVAYEKAIVSLADSLIRKVNLTGVSVDGRIIERT